MLKREISLCKVLEEKCLAAGMLILVCRFPDSLDFPEWVTKVEVFQLKFSQLLNLGMPSLEYLMRELQDESQQDSSERDRQFSGKPGKLLLHPDKWRGMFLCQKPLSSIWNISIYQRKEINGHPGGLIPNYQFYSTSQNVLGEPG